MIFNGVKRFTMFFCLLIFLQTLVAVVSADESVNDGIVHLQIIDVNDFHGMIDSSSSNAGFAKLVSAIDYIKNENPKGTIVLAAGDMFQGSMNSNLFFGAPVVDVMNEVPFDAMTIGNHEFDWTKIRLRQRVAQSSFPWVCANILDKNTGELMDFGSNCKPYIIVDKEGIKVGIIGFATPDTPKTTIFANVADCNFADPINVLDKYAPIMRKEGADIIVALTHLACDMDENGNISGDAVNLANKAKDVDVVIGGHSHKTVYGLVNGRAVVQANWAGRAVGRVLIDYDLSKHKVVSEKATVIKLPYSGLTENVETQKILSADLNAIKPLENEVLCTLVKPLDHAKGNGIMQETSEGQWISDQMRIIADADIAFYNMGGIRVPLAAGKVTAGNLYEVVPFDNTVCVVSMTGSQVMSVLNYAVDATLQKTLGMVQYSGIVMKVNNNKPVGERIISVETLDGKPLELKKIYKVAMNDFMYGGGDGFTMFAKDTKDFINLNVPVRDELAQIMRAKGTIDFTPDNRLIIVK